MGNQIRGRKHLTVGLLTLALGFWMQCTAYGQTVIPGYRSPLVTTLPTPAQFRSHLGGGSGAGQSQVSNEIKELEIGKKEMQRNSLFIISGLVIILVIFVYLRYRSKKKSAEILTAKNDLITQQKEVLSETLEELQRIQKMFLLSVRAIISII